MWKLLPIIISLIALSIVIYRDFFQGAKLKASINQVVLMRLAEKNKENLTLKTFLEEISSIKNHKLKFNISDSDYRLIQNNYADNQEKIKKLIKKIEYAPPVNVLEKYFDDYEFASSFYLPLTINNIGRKHAFVNSLVVIFEKADDVEKKWAYVPFLLVNKNAIVDRTRKYKDSERLKEIFCGISVGPSDNITVHPLFTLYFKEDIKNIIATSIIPGKYNVTLYGYDQFNKQILKTNTIVYTLTKNNLIDSYRGLDQGAFTSREKDVVSSLK